MTTKRQNGAGDRHAKGRATQGEPPAYFLTLRLRNARCFGPEEQVLDLSDGNGRPARWTLLLGENGSGKTTLLQALVLLHLIPELFGRFPVGPELPRNLPVEARRAFLRQHTEGLLRQAHGTMTHIAGTIATGASLADGAFHSTQATLELGLGSVQSYGTIGPTCYAYGASRRVGSSALGETEAIGLTATLFSDRAELLNAEEWLLQLDYSASKKSAAQQRQRERLEQVQRLLLNILPEVREIRFEAGTGIRPHPRVEFLTPYGWVPLRQLGYGYQTLIAWMVDLASRMLERYPDSPDPLAEPAVVLVDEIDLHLHPTWQRKLLGYLTERFPNTQFIATAHSPLVVQAATGANLVLLRREGDHVVIDNDVKAIRGWRIDQVLTSELFGVPSARPPEFDDLLEERDKILGKSRLTSSDKKRLAKLEAQIGELPVGESTSQR
jgi:hypothetical protein